jgi:opacity protein-like surface antigen
MKTLLYTAVAALALMGTAQADTICNNCEYVNRGPTYVPYPGTYLGAYWPGDRGTFRDTHIQTDLGRSGLFNDYWIVDLNQNSVIELTITTKANTALDATHPELDGPFAAEISWDHGSVCSATPGGFCDRDPTILYDEVVLSEWSALERRWTFRTGALVPGRYLFRFVGAARAVGESSYAGKILVKVAP